MAHKFKKGMFQPVKRAGAATAKAKREGVSLSKWEQEHKNDPGVTGKQARFPLIAKKWHHGKVGKKNAKRSVKTKKADRKREARKRA